MILKTIPPMSRTLLTRSQMTPAQRKGMTQQRAPVWYRPNTLRRSSQNQSHYSRVLERVKLRVPWITRVLRFLQQQGSFPFSLGVEVFSLQESFLGVFLGILSLQVFLEYSIAWETSQSLICSVGSKSYYFVRQPQSISFSFQTVSS